MFVCPLFALALFLCICFYMTVIGTYILSFLSNIRMLQWLVSNCFCPGRSCDEIQQRTEKIQPVSRVWSNPLGRFWAERHLPDLYSGDFLFNP